MNIHHRYPCLPISCCTLRASRKGSRSGPLSAALALCAVIGLSGMPGASNAQQRTRDAPESESAAMASPEGARSAKQPSRPATRELTHAVRQPTASAPDGFLEAPDIPGPFADDRVTAGHSFALLIDDVAIGQIQKVSGLTVEQESIEHKQGAERAGTGALGRQTPARITLTRIRSQDTGFARWARDSGLGEAGDGSVRSNGAIIVYDQAGGEIGRYKLGGAWPQSLEIGSLKAGSSEVAVETLTLTVQSIEPE